MNKKTFFLLLALLTLNLSACSSNTEETPQAETATPNNYTAQSTDTVISGEVTAIAGNYVTLALGTVEENSESGENADNGGSSDNNSGSAAPSGDAPEMPSGGDMPEMPSGDMPSDGNMPADGSMPSDGSMPADDSMHDFGGGQGGGRSSATITKSGEEGSYIIPVGMIVDGLSGRSTDYSGISVGTILTLTVSEDGTVRAASAE